MAKKQQTESQPEPIQSGHRPAMEIISQFLAEIQNHPDFQVANCEINGPCPQNLMFKDTPRNMQHLTSLRIVHREPLETPEQKANKPWKWQGVIDEINTAPAPAVPEAPNPKWAHLLPPKNKPELEAALP